MAVKKKVAPVKNVKKAGRPSNPANTDKAKPTGKPIVTFLPPKLHARCKLAAIALSTNLSTVIRGLLSDWVVEQKDAIAEVINMGDTSDVDEVEEEEEEDTDTDTDDDEEVDEDEDEDEE